MAWQVKIFLKTSTNCELSRLKQVGAKMLAYQNKNKFVGLQKRERPQKQEQKLSMRKFDRQPQSKKRQSQ